MRWRLYRARLGSGLHVIYHKLLPPYVLAHVWFISESDSHMQLSLDASTTLLFPSMPLSYLPPSVARYIFFHNSIFYFFAFLSRFISKPHTHKKIACQTFANYQPFFNIYGLFSYICRNCRNKSRYAQKQCKDSFDFVFCRPYSPLPIIKIASYRLFMQL